MGWIGQSMGWKQKSMGQIGRNTPRRCHSNPRMRANAAVRINCLTYNAHTAAGSKNRQPPMRRRRAGAAGRTHTHKRTQRPTPLRPHQRGGMFRHARGRHPTTRRHIPRRMRSQRAQKQKIRHVNTLSPPPVALLSDCPYICARGKRDFHGLCPGKRPCQPRQNPARHRKLHV